MSKLTKWAKCYGRTDPSYRKVFAMTNIYIFLWIGPTVRNRIINCTFPGINFFYINYNLQKYQLCTFIYKKALEQLFGLI